MPPPIPSPFTDGAGTSPRATRPGTDAIPSPFGLADRGIPDPFAQSVTAFEQTATPRVKLWYLQVEENTELFTRGMRIWGQYVPQQISQKIEAKIGEAGGFSRNHPIINWLGGALREVSFQARLFSNHSQDFSARDKIRLLELLMEKHSPLGRPPLVRFYWGDSIQGGMRCFVSTLGGISYDEVRTDGSIRGATLNITLKRFEQYRFQQTVANVMERTPTHVVKDGETYEMIAYRHYNNPMLGVSLRQENPRRPMTSGAPTQVADLSAGDLVKLYNESELPVPKPSNHLLRQDTMLQQANRMRFVSKRAGKIAMLPSR